ncbi:MAG: lantibiotic dehydratase [Proteobacteria bacterium]|nr:lantibiotic dehydratase [Pseudomonadota bacterium]
MVEQILASERALRDGREAVSAAMFAVIGSCLDRSTRNTMLRCRRDLFAGRAPRASDLSVLSAVGAVTFADVVQPYANAVTEVETLRKRFANQYQHSLVLSRAVLREQVNNIAFQNALAMSSDALTANLAKYREGRFDKESRHAHVERGLLRYFTRMAMKATPFSQFCTVLPGRVIRSTTDAQGRGIGFAGAILDRTSVVRLNKKLYVPLMRRLTQRAAVRMRLPAALNSTIEHRDGTFRFLSKVDGFEVFQSVDATDSISWLYEKLRREGARPFGQLVDDLLSSPEIEATHDAAHEYLEELVRIGFLSLKEVVRDQEPDWDKPLVKFLEPIADSTAHRTVEMLRQMREVADRFHGCSPDVRAREIRALRTVVRDGFASISVPVPREAELPILEDVTGAGEAQIFVSPLVAEAFTRLTEFLRFIRPLGEPYREQATMRAYFDQRYTEPSAEVPLLRFYEDYYRNHFKEHLRRSTGAALASGDATYDIRNPFDLAFIAENDRRAEQLRRTIVQAWRLAPDAEEIRISQDTLAGLSAPLSGRVTETRLSLSVFCQCGVREGRGFVCAPMGGFVLGYGKFFSRFLHLLPLASTDTVRAYNRETTDGMLAEIEGDAGHNANFHPRMVDCDIAYPLSSSVTSEGALSTRDLVVQRDDTNPHALRLSQASSGRRILPLDLGYLNPMMRPPLYQLIRSFGPLKSFGLWLPDRLPDTSGPEMKSGVSAQAPSSPMGTAAELAGVAYRPRITYDGAVVLFRRQWHVPMASLPQLAKGESSAAFFLRINRWRSSLGVPNEVFVKLKWKAGNSAGVTRSGGNDDAQSSGQETLDGRFHGEVFLGGADEIATRESIDRDELAPVREPALGIVDGSQRAIEADADDLREERLAQPAPAWNSRDYAKPQFVDFRTPLLVDLFARIAGSLDNFDAILEERLPADDELPMHNGECYATELTMEVVI